MRVLRVGPFVSKRFTFADQTHRDEERLVLTVERIRRIVAKNARRINRSGPTCSFDLETARSMSEYRDWHVRPDDTDQLFFHLHRVAGRNGVEAYVAAFRFAGTEDLDLVALAMYLPAPGERMVFFEILRAPDLQARLAALTEDAETFETLIAKATAARELRR